MTDICDHFEQDDQVLFNNALHAMKISLTRTSFLYEDASNSSLFKNENKGWVGHTPGSEGLKVTLLPQGVACRGEGCMKETQEKVYIWHHGSTRHKMDNMSNKAGQDGVWFLCKDWESVRGESFGVDWLSSIALPNTTSL